jgi:hypothetical protein
MVSHMFYVGTLSSDRNATIPTITDSLYASGLIRENLVAVAFQPFNSTNITPGDVTIMSGVLNWGLCFYHFKF